MAVSLINIMSRHSLIIVLLDSLYCVVTLHTGSLSRDEIPSPSEYLEEEDSDPTPPPAPTSGIQHQPTPSTRINSFHCAVQTSRTQIRNIFTVYKQIILWQLSDIGTILNLNCKFLIIVFQTSMIAVILSTFYESCKAKLRRKNT